MARDNSAHQRVDCGVLWPKTSEHALWHRVPVAPAGLFVGAWLGGYLYDLTTSYELMWWLNAAAGLFAFGINWLIREAPAMPQPASARHVSAKATYSCSPSQRSASSAAIQPMPAAVTA